jgi:hypothetical protein
MVKESARGRGAGEPRKRRPRQPADVDQLRRRYCEAQQDTAQDTALKRLAKAGGATTVPCICGTAHPIGAGR